MAAAHLDKALAFLVSTLFLVRLLEALLLQALAAGAIEFSLSVLSTPSFFRQVRRTRDGIASIYSQVSTRARRCMLILRIIYNPVSAKQSAPAEGTATTTSPHDAAPESEPTNGHTSVFSLSSLRGSLPSVSLPSLSLPSVSLPPFFASGSPFIYSCPDFVHSHRPRCSNTCCGSCQRQAQEKAAQSMRFM